VNLTVNSKLHPTHCVLAEVCTCDTRELDGMTHCSGGSARYINPRSSRGICIPQLYKRSIPSNSHGQTILVKSSISDGGSDTCASVALYRRVRYRCLYHRLTRVTVLLKLIIPYAVLHQQCQYAALQIRIFSFARRRTVAILPLPSPLWIRRERENSLRSIRRIELYSRVALSRIR